MKDINPIDIGDLLKEAEAVYAYNFTCKRHEDKIVPAFWGPPGIGKTQVNIQATLALGVKLGLPYTTQVLGLASLSPIDVGGFPYREDDYARQAKPFYFPKEGQYVNVFLDEINTAPAINQVTAYSLTLNGAIQHHVMPIQTMISVAGNRAKDKGATHTMPKPLENRLTHYEVTTSPKSWLAYGAARGFHPDILGLIGYKGTLLMNESPQPEERAFTTPRAWEKVSNLMNAGINSRPTISGTIGLGAYSELISFVKLRKELPDLDSMLDTGRTDLIPTKRDMLYMFMHSLTNKLLDTYSLKPEGVKRSDNFFKLYAVIPADLKVVVIHTLVAHPKGAGIVNNPLYRQTIKDALNGKV